MQHLIRGISSGGREVPDLDGKRFVVTRAEGAYVWDDAGRRYVDTALGFGATFLGHTDPVVTEAIHDALNKGSMPAYAHTLEEEAAAALAAHTQDLTKVIFLNSGSEAVHLACRAGRALTGRQRIVKMAAGYDGWFDDVAFGNAGSPEAGMSANERPSKGDTLLLRFNDRQDAELLFQEYDDVAAIVLEPMMANAGCILADAGYLQFVADLARTNGAVVIMDEVLMGFRLHGGLASQLMGVKPDMAAVGKAIGNGVAVAALLGTPEAMTVFEDGRVNRAGTYNGNPVACAAVKAAMSVIDTVDYKALEKAGDDLRDYAVQCFTEVGIETCTSGYGTVFTLWPGSQAPVNYREAVQRVDKDFTARLHIELRRNGVMSMYTPFGRHYLSARHDEDALSLWASALDQAAKSIAARGEPTEHRGRAG